MVPYCLFTLVTTFQPWFNIDIISLFNGVLIFKIACSESVSSFFSFVYMCI